MPKGAYRYKKRPPRKRVGLVKNYSPRLTIGILSIIGGLLIIIIHLLLNIIF